MNKNELTVELKKQGLHKFLAVMEFLKHVMTLGTGLGVVWVIMEALKAMTAGKDASGIAALAQVVTALDLGTIVGYIWAAGATVLWLKERKGKKRAISRKSELQDRLEGGETNRTSSELTVTGDTP